jgi:hypothetical protein
MTNPQLEFLFKEALQIFVKKEPVPSLEARFYPYAGLSSTIRLRNGHIYARVSDILEKAPDEVLFALACILIAKLYRRKAPKVQQELYRSYITQQPVADASDSTRRQRGYKLTTSPRGAHYDLEELFDSLNARYFDGELTRPLLSWSTRKARRVLGHHDNIHSVIIISRALDTAETPRFVVEYVLYHEMLHIKHPQRYVDGRKIIHGAEFRAEERRFQNFLEANKWLEQIALPVRRRLRRKARRWF